MEIQSFSNFIIPKINNISKTIEILNFQRTEELLRGYHLKLKYFDGNSKFNVKVKS